MNHVLKSFSTPSVSLLANSFKNAKNLSSVSKDLAKQNSLVTQNTDLLINNLKNARSVITVLELVKTHNKLMNPNHTIEALKTIFALQKHNTSETSSSNILKHPDFETICNQLRYQAGALDLSQTLQALKVISFLGVPSSSRIYQILLQLIRHDINTMSLQQIMFTDFILSKAKTCPLVEALKIALPMVYDIQLPIKLDRTNTEHLAEHLHYVSKNPIISEESVMAIINSLMKTKVFNEKTSISIIWSICDFKPNIIFEPLLNKAIKSLFISGNSVSYDNLETSISKLTQRYSAKTPFYYSNTLFDYCANIVIKDDLGFENAVHLLRKFLKVKHFDMNLLDYISQKCHRNPDLIENGDPLLTYNVIRGCALTDFRPKYYDTIKKAFLKIKTFSNYTHKDIYLLKFQTSLSVLDIYIPEILEKALNEEYLKRLFRKNYMADFEDALLISQAIKTLRPEFSNYLPSESFLKYIKSRIRSTSDYPVQGVLHYLFRDEKFVKTPASTKMLHHIDHLIILKKGYPCPLNAEDVYVEDMQCDSLSQIVLIITLKDFHYTINQQLLGSTSLMLQTLEEQGYSVIPISLSLWKNMPEVERIPYIVEAIKSKTELFDEIYDVS